MTNDAGQRDACEPIKPSAIIARSWGLLRHNLPLFVPIALVGHMLLVASALAGRAPYGWAVELLLGLPAMLVAFWGFGALTIAASSRYRDREITVKESFGKARGRYWRYTMVSVLYTLVGVVGLLLLVLPGVYWGTILCLSPYVAILDEPDARSPFKRSRELVRGSFWQVLLIELLFVVLSVVAFAVGLALQNVHPYVRTGFSTIYALLLGPFSIVTHAILYHELDQRRPRALPPETEARPEPTGAGCCGGCAAAVGLVAAMWTLMIVWYALLGGASLMERLSPPVKLAHEVEWERPDGWRTVRLRQDTPTYWLGAPRNSAIRGLALWSVALQELKTQVSDNLAADEALAQEIEKTYCARVRLLGEPRDAYEHRASEGFTVDGRAWAVHVFAREPSPDQREAVDVRKHAYAVFEEAVIVLTYELSLSASAVQEGSYWATGEREQLVTVHGFSVRGSAVRGWAGR